MSGINIQKNLMINFLKDNDCMRKFKINCIMHPSFPTEQISPLMRYINPFYASILRYNPYDTYDLSYFFNDIESSEGSAYWAMKSTFLKLMINEQKKRKK